MKDGVCAKHHKWITVLSDLMRTGKNLIVLPLTGRSAR